MMQLYAVSDTHGYHGNFSLLKAIAGTDEVAHLGDYCSDGQALADYLGRPVHVLKGNCDFSGDYPNQEIITLGGKKILLVHGHLQSVKYSLERLYLTALEAGAECAVYGHTHIPAIDVMQGVVLVCPGAFGRAGATYARITVEDGRLRPQILTV